MPKFMQLVGAGSWMSVNHFECDFGVYLNSNLCMHGDSFCGCVFIYVSL